MEPFEEAAADAAGVTVPAPVPGTVGCPVPCPVLGPAPAPGAAPDPDPVALVPFVTASPPQPETLRLRTQQSFPLGHIPVAGDVGSSPFLHVFLQLPSLFAHFLTYQLPAERRASHQAWVLSRPR